MGLLRRTPAEVQEIVPSGERVLAWSRVTPGGVAVATDAALYLPIDGTLRLAWALAASAAVILA